MMPEPVIGRTTYTRRLDSIRHQFGVLMEVLQALGEDPGPQERISLLMEGTNAIIQGTEDVLLLERFGSVFKETGELNAEILKNREQKS